MTAVAIADPSVPVAAPLAVADTVHSCIASRFRRAEARARARRYLAGLVAPVERKNGWQLAEYLGEPGPQGVQRLLNAAGWDAEAVRDDLRAFVIAQLGAPDGVLVLDETGFLKKGTKSVGVARQYSGTAGRRENQQIGVFLLYASTHGAAFLDRALYLPAVWATDAARRAAAGVPGDVTFATKGDLAQAMLARAFAAGIPAAWVVGDTVYGHDDLRRWLEEQGRSYVVAVPSTHGIWTAA
jgi:SRSO17 transposase